MDKYAEERAKRLNPKGSGQYVDLALSDKYGKFIEDPWIKPNTPINDPVPDGGHCKFVIGKFRTSLEHCQCVDFDLLLRVCISWCRLRRDLVRSEPDQGRLQGK